MLYILIIPNILIYMQNKRINKLLFIICYVLIGLLILIKYLENIRNFFLKFKNYLFLFR